MKRLPNLQLLLNLLLPLLLSPSLISAKTYRPPGTNDAILLSKVQALTLRGDRPTSSRRVSPIPQLKCTGPSARLCDQYPIDTMRCTNAGYDYDEEDVQWTCTAELPPELKLGSTDVVCEGYRSADDPWVLKGSCGVEYRLLLTERGERMFGKMGREGRSSSSFSGSKSRNFFALVGDLIFFGFIVACFALILWPMLRQCFGGRRMGGVGSRRWGGGDGGGWGGWGGGGGPFYPPGPPPPYSDCNNGASSSAGWRPGFWTGALGGAAAGYQLGRGNTGRPMTSFRRGNDRYDPGEGSSQSSRFSSPTTSTGFGSTRRR